MFNGKSTITKLDLKQLSTDLKYTLKHVPFQSSLLETNLCDRHDSQLIPCEPQVNSTNGSVLYYPVFIIPQKYKMILLLQYLMLEVTQIPDKRTHSFSNSRPNSNSSLKIYNCISRNPILEILGQSRCYQTRFAEGRLSTNSRKPTNER